MNDYALASTIYFRFTTRAFATGAPTALGSGAVSVMEDGTDTAMTAVSATVVASAVTGMNVVTVTATTANGFESGKEYDAYLSAGSVSGVSVVGEVVGHFSIEKSPTFTRLGAPAGASVSADIAAIEAQTDDIGAAGAGLTAVTAAVTAAERNVRQTVESQRGHHTACGAIFYVQKGGSDANPGTYLLPFLTIQAALNACTANAHDTVVVLGITGSAPSVFDEALTMSKQFVFLRGMGRDTKIIRTGAASKNITISANGCEVSGFWINNTGTGATEGIDLASGSDFAWLHHLFIDGTSASMTGIEVVAGANTTIENCRINDVLATGINVAQGAAVGLHTRILNNHIDGCGTGINFAGGDSSESVAKYNQISGCTTGVVVASGALKVQVTDNRLSGNGTNWTDAGTDTNLSFNTLGTNISGAVNLVTTTTTLTNLPAITANWLTAAGTAADFGAELATAIWTDTTAGDFTVAASIGKSVMNGVALGTGLTINAYTGNTVQTGDSFARIGAPAGASASADIAAVKVDTAAILVDTGTTLDGRIPAALTAGGNMKSDALAISGSTAAADNLEESTEAIAYGTVDGTGATTTVFLSSALTPDSAVNDQFKGRVLIFKNDTTTANLRGQATTISSYVHTSAEIGTFTVVALTTLPQTGDTFVIL